MVARVRGVRKGVAQRIKRDRDGRDHDNRENELIPLGGDQHDLAAFVDHIAQRGDRHRETQADIGQEHLGSDGIGDGQSPSAA